MCFLVLASGEPRISRALGRFALALLFRPVAGDDRHMQGCQEIAARWRVDGPDGPGSDGEQACGYLSPASEVSAQAQVVCVG